MHAFRPIGSLAAAAVLAGALLAAPAIAQTPDTDAADSVSLGGGTAGSAGVPVLGYMGSPIVGNPLRMRVTGARPNAHGCVGFSAFETPIAIPFFETTVHPGFPLFALELFVTDGEGRSPVVLDVPVVDASLCGVTFVAQGMIEDPLGPNGTAFTAGRRVEFGVAASDRVLPVPKYDLGERPVDVAIGDVDGDGLPDVVVGHDASTGITIHLGRPQGGLTPLGSLPQVGSVKRIALGDFDEDGALDLIVSNQFGVELLLGSGDGSFADARPVDGVSSSFDWEVADMNADGHADLVTLAGVVSVWAGDGSGAFALTSTSALVPGFLTGLEVGDIDNDGVEDVAVTRFGQGSLAVLLGTGDGTLVPGPALDTTANSRAVLARDVDQDGVTDLVVALDEGFDGPGGVDVLLGVGGGAFAPRAFYLAGNDVVDVAAEDLDGDGRVDLVALNATSADISVLRQQPDGTFSEPERYGFGFSPIAVAIDDFDGDGQPDFIGVQSRQDRFRSGFPGQIALYRGTVGGSVDHGRRFPSSSSASPWASGDIDRDGALDLVRGDFSDPMAIYFGDGKGGVGAPVAFPVEDVVGVELFDVDGDGLLDLVSYQRFNKTFPQEFDYSVGIAFGDSTGGFEAPDFYPVGVDPKAITFDDFDENGAIDIAVACEGESTHIGGEITIYFGQGSRQFVRGAPLLPGETLRDLTSGDVDGDGYADLVSLAWFQGPVVQLGLGDGTFELPVEYQAGNFSIDVDLADFDRDGDLDIAVVNLNSFSVSIFLNDGAGVFDSTQDYAVGISPRLVGISDLDGDGELDVLVANASLDYSLLLGVGDGALEPERRFIAGGGNQRGTLADMDGDGLDDVVAGASFSYDEGWLTLNRRLARE
jgi:hypothetical protein